MASPSSQAGAPNNPLCPKCGASMVLPLAGRRPQAEPPPEADEDQVLLGGRCVLDDQPQWRCQVCGHEWTATR